MAKALPELLESFFNQIESQIQFGDSKASLLIAGDAILLAVAGGLVKMVSGCPGDLTVSCVVLSWSLGLAVTAAALLTLSLLMALLAARPASIHSHPPANLFLLSYIARMDRDTFVKEFKEASTENLTQEALTTIYRKAGFAARKFRLLKQAVDATLTSLGFMVASLVVEVGARIV
jgi:hypothetical protein